MLIKERICISIANLGKNFLKMAEYYLTQINHVVIMSEMLKKYLRDYPSNLPDEIASAIERDRPKIKQGIDKTAEVEFTPDKNILDATLRNGSRLPRIELDEEISYNLVLLEEMKKQALKTAPYKEKLEYFDFSYSINSQELIQLIGYAEGFIDQTVDLMLIIEKEKCFDYLQKALPKEDIQRLSEKKKVEKLQRYLGKSITKRLQFLENAFDLNLKIREDTRKVVKLNEEFRHIIVHKSGIIDKVFIERTKLTEQKIGEKIYINEGMNKALKFSITSITLEFQDKISNKYFRTKN